MEYGKEDGHDHEWGQQPGGFKYVLSQQVIPLWDFGHYHWALTDRAGNILRAGGSVGGPPPRKTQADVHKMAKEEVRSYLDGLAVQEKGDKAMRESI